MALLKILQAFLAKNKPHILKIFLLIEILMPVLYVIGVYVYRTNPDGFVPFYTAGLTFGTVSFYLYVSTLVPGILKRFQVLPLVQSIFMLFRRHLGIMMFLTAFVHMGYVQTIPAVFGPTGIHFDLFPHVIYGFLAWAILFPLWLTSNEYSVRKLKRNWIYLHRLTYIACFFVFMHTSITDTTLAAIAACFIVLEIGSWIADYLRKRKAKLQPPAVVSVSPTVTSPPVTPPTPVAPPPNSV